ncbi:putative late blight resistance protein homolog R1B-17 isoform X2 [Lycium barbarum]|uniref:putative late blight resistance protein homolog R1B-17 isoform X2 n=1 Tax=Lycium barbarum TaxID=112863 RepID=UPI00293F3313|nr:putative late blight resistance protein homolog R1B-17 isoform X2 [Lycium barbarum]
MAYAAVTSLMSTLGLLMQSNSCLNLPQEKQTESLCKKIRERIQSFREKLRLLQECLENLDKNIDDRKAVERCEGKIKLAARDAEYGTESVLEKIYKAENEKVRREAYEELYKRLQQASKSINSNCGKLTQSMKSTGLQAATTSLVHSFDLPEHSPQLDNCMVGHVNELEDMKSKLMETLSNESEIVAIVGMGGIGKTTFARRVYDDPTIKSHFDILAWATMSKQYCVRRMLLQLLHCIPSTKDVIREEMDDGDLAGKLKQRLSKRRYLIVIDDIWSTDAWDDISQWFPDCRGSHILLTTRCGNVASYAAPGKPPRHMSFLCAKESWELLQSKVQLSPELLEVGMKIADYCHGVPLTITIVAGLLSKCNNALDGWEQVAQDVKSAIFKDPGRQCEKVLALSYYYLPQHLKACFLYFGVFPGDDEVNVTRLINLWVAEGLLKEADDTKSLEDVAEECLQELIDRNLVLVGQQNFCGEVETCKIHDLLHELCLRQARGENFLPVISNETWNQLAPRVSRSFIQVCLMKVRSIIGFHWLNSHDHYDPNKIHTFLYRGERVYIVDQRGNIVADCERKKTEILEFKNFKMIRVLDLRMLCLRDGVPTLFYLVHLRYLHLSINGHKCLPRFKFQNLQVLIVERENPGSVMMRIEIWRMPQLRYVQFMNTGWRCPPNIPNDEGGEHNAILEHLHTITGVGPSWCKEEIFALMPNLKKLQVVVDRNDEESLDDIRSSDDWDYLWPKNPAHDAFFKNLSAFPPTLRRLTLCGLCLNWAAMDIVGMLPNLEALELKDNACGHYSLTTWRSGREND